MENISKKAFETYTNNMSFLEKRHKTKFDKIKLFELI